MSDIINFDNGTKIRWMAGDLESLVTGDERLHLQENSSWQFSVELFVPRGPSFLYGGLGAKRLIGDVLSSVTVAAPHGQKEPDALASSIDDIRWGLPVEYREAICSEALSIGFAWPVEFDQAIYGAVGSSGAIFSVLAKAIANATYIDINNVKQISESILDCLVTNKVLQSKWRRLG